MAGHRTAGLVHEGARGTCWLVKQIVISLSVSAKRRRLPPTKPHGSEYKSPPVRFPGIPFCSTVLPSFVDFQKFLPRATISTTRIGCLHLEERLWGAVAFSHTRFFAGSHGFQVEQSSMAEFQLPGNSARSQSCCRPIFLQGRSSSTVWKRLRGDRHAVNSAECAAVGPKTTHSD